MYDELTLEECLTILKANRAISENRRFALQDDVLDMCISYIQHEIAYRNSDAYKRANQ